MGIADRDYMHERKEPTFDSGPASNSASKFGKKSGSRSKLWTFLVWLSILFILYRSFLWWETRSQLNRTVNESVEVTTPENPVPADQPKTPQVIQRKRQSPTVSNIAVITSHHLGSVGQRRWVCKGLFFLCW